jgi:hypothetical protein
MEFKILKSGLKSEQGFVAIVALFAALVLIAIGFYALNTTSNDLFISAKMVGESRAFAASESCWNIFAATYDPSTYDPNAASVTDTNTIDPSDPNLTCTTKRQTLPSLPVSLSGFEGSGGVSWVYLVWQLTIDGNDNSYLGHAQTQSAVAYGPVKGSTEY